MPDEPWKKIWATLWNALTNGRRKWITVPLFVIGSIFLSLPDANEKIQSSYRLLKAKLYPTTYLSREEYDICNEWVAVVWSYKNQKKAETELELFKDAYFKTEQKTWKDDIFLVRSPKEHNVWQIVIDMAPGASKESTVKAQLEELRRYGNKNREIRNTFGQWLDTAYVQRYEMDNFKIAHGEPENISDGCNK